MPKLRAKPIYYPDKLPAILGCDGAGIVEKIGSAVTRFKDGDAVYFNNGGWRNQATSRAVMPNTPRCMKNIARLPPPMSACRTSPDCRWC